MPSSALDHRPRSSMAIPQLPPWPLHLIITLLFLLPFQPAAANDSTALLNFKTDLSSGGSSTSGFKNWSAAVPPCISHSLKFSYWKGVSCKQGLVYGLTLENMNLTGKLSIGALTGLTGLRVLSFKDNKFEGEMPDLNKLPDLKHVYLSGNRFSGEIPDDMFRGSRGLTSLSLSKNSFSGSIPSSLTMPANLSELLLDGNKFEGEIPEFAQANLVTVNVAFNQLEGPIPVRLSSMNASLFQGNKDLCGLPLAVKCRVKKKKFSSVLLIAIILIAVVASLAILGAIILLRRRGQKAAPKLGQFQSRTTTQTVNHFKIGGGRTEIGLLNCHSSDAAAAVVEEKGKLLFVTERRERFELQDLLRSSAEVLGSTNFGSSFKAVLLNGPAVVVKKFQDMNAVGREEFQVHMKRLGRLSHPNLLPLIAYYRRKEETLLVSDYIPNGSLAHMLHGKRGTKNSPLDWPMRLNIIKGVARGLAHLYQELPMLHVPHGHLKSSNVLLDLSFEAVLTDYGLMPVINKSLAADVMVAYKSPECAHHGKPSKKSDVWSLGILILEVLTGKFPANQLRRGRAGTDLAGWVNSVVREEWTGEVFDGSMKGTKNCEGEMLKLLQIGMACCEMDVNKRMDLEVALGKINDLREKESDMEFSSVASDPEGYSSKILTDDELSLSMASDRRDRSITE